MNSDRIHGKLKQYAGKIREILGRIVSDAGVVNAGRNQQREGRMQELYGVRQGEARRQMRNFLRRNRLMDTSRH